MPDPKLVADHYTHGRLLDAIRDGVQRLGKTPETVTVEDLGPVEEFHIGGRVASQEFLDQLSLSPEHHVLDVGCGLGGTSRFVAKHYRCRITGVDLTAEYVEVGRALGAWVGLAGRVALEQGDVTALSCADDSFDRAFMLHVGMNIADKARLMAELYRVLKPGGRVGVYDVMRIGPGELTFPVPWATTPEGSNVASPDEYKDALAAAGFEVASGRNRREFALEFFDRLRAAAAGAQGPPPLGLHILMGETAPLKVRNMIENVSRSRIAPVELIAHKPA